MKRSAAHDGVSRFASRANDYAVARPSYPSAAIDALFEGLGALAGLTVIDLGAGTGISSQLLAARGPAVLAVEPSAAMRERAQPATGVTWRAGTAEATGLPNACADLVTAFQAFHWFDSAATLREIARLLRPGGRAAIVYNERDECDRFTAAYGDLTRRFATDATESRRSDARAVFAASPTWGDCRVLVYNNRQPLDRSGIHARARSTSYLPETGAAAAELHTALDALFEKFAFDGLVTLHLTTSVGLAEMAARR